MNSFSLTNSLSVSVRLYRALLVAYPKKFREHYETQLVQVFRDSFRYEYHRNGMSGIIDLWLHTFTDLVFNALMERISERSQYMFSPKVILWGGLAGALSGLFWLMSGISLGVGFVLALVLGLGGLVSLYSRQAGRGGRLGLTGFALGIIGTVLALATLLGISSSSVNLEIDPVGAAPAVGIFSLVIVILSVGLALLGITNLRVKTPHRWRGLPLGVGLLSAVNGMTFWLVYYVPLSQGRNPFDTWPPEGYALNATALVLLGLGWIGLGTMLASEGDAQIPVAQPPQIQHKRDI